MAVDVEASIKRGHEAGKERAKLCVYEFYAGSGDHTENFTIPMRELVFKNDSTNDFTVQLLGPDNLNITFTVKGKEVFDERFPEFTTLVIEGTGAWRFYPRSHVIA